MKKFFDSDCLREAEFYRNAVPKKETTKDILT